MNRSWSLIFGEQPEQFAHIAHCWWATWAICSHCSLIKEGMSKSLIFFNLQKKYRKRTKKYNSSQTCLSELLVFCERKTDLLKKKSDSLICSFIMSDLSESLTVTHLSWANWVIHSQWLICPEQSERIAHNCSFDLSDLSEWANEGWLNERTCLYCDANGGLRLVSRWTILG